uniref:Uncharacterized protein n=1 Tax=Setaria viridis TaxID=4556 RepID=A0A4U6UY59_SETVI|nr:hypothetical protein SEVIR_4G005400v2 [Setaria viridis]
MLVLRPSWPWQLPRWPCRWRTGRRRLGNGFPPPATERVLHLSPARSSQLAPTCQCQEAPRRAARATQLCSRLAPNQSLAASLPSPAAGRDGGHPRRTSTQTRAGWASPCPRLGRRDVTSLARFRFGVVS